MTKQSRLWTIVCMTVLLLALGTQVSVAKEKTLTLYWIQWPPAALWFEIGQEWSKETGVKLEAVFTPAPEWWELCSTKFAAHDSTYDIVVGDSQWTGAFVEGGHIIDLTEWMKENLEFDDYFKTTLNAYGEYPRGSKRYYAVPHMVDVPFLVYRKDLFEDPKEKKAFWQKYGYELAPPQTWTQYRDIAEFFTRPEKRLWGSALKYAKGHDEITCDWLNIFWSYGGKLWDEKTYRVDGYINSEVGVKSLELMVEFLKYSPLGTLNFSYDEAATAMQQGMVAMTVNWAGYCPGFIDPEASLTADKVGFSVLPGQIAPDGKFRRVICIGGQGSAVSAYSKNKELALEFIKWFQEKEQQRKWVLGGGGSSRISILESEEFLNAKPWNVAFYQTLTGLKDFWNLPCYYEMVVAMQEELHTAAAGMINAKTALDNIARRHENILKKAGYL